MQVEGMYNKAHEFQRQKLEGRGHHTINVEIKVCHIFRTAGMAYELQTRYNDEARTITRITDKRHELQS